MVSRHDQALQVSSAGFSGFISVPLLPCTTFLTSHWNIFTKGALAMKPPRCPLSIKSKTQRDRGLLLKSHCSQFYFLHRQSREKAWRSRICLSHSSGVTSPCPQPLPNLIRSLAYSPNSALLSPSHPRFPTSHLISLSSHF